ncbi:glycosyltransferase family 2 protein [Phenylobacterium soli]|uniref:Glycosyltransferase n=1 Tax=Phenylobacterium soli TaxID=2170551 RepID=A0A328AFP2_9CAUL|nr:glycosyltransferase family 2 protein [Phenylobacterium soli]RAK53431.1 glycosyltransferase [Phenylobacterium soli]
MTATTTKAAAQAAPAAAPVAVRSSRGKRLSLVVPMHNEAPVFDALFERLEATVGKLRIDLEIVCVDDGSRDNTLDLLRAKAKADKRIRAVALSRNFGKEAALTAGLEAATGDMVVPLDADLQDPPELIAEFVALWEQGYDVVYGVRSDRTSDTVLKRTTANLFYRVFNMLSDYPIPASTGDFRLMDRRVVEALMRLPERNRFMKGLFAWVGFRQVGVPYVRPARMAGETAWGYRKLMRFAVDGLTAFTTLPLRIWTLVGIGSAVLAVITGLGLIVRVLVVGRDVPGYASLMVVLLFGFALQMIALGVMGEYLGRMYQEVKGRPTYLVKDRIGFDS